MLSSGDEHASRGRHAPGGFTLIETIMVMAIVGLLIALVVPQLGLVREAALRTKSRSNLRSHVQIFAIYSGEHEGELPFFMRSDTPETIIRGGGRAIRVPLRHFFFASAAFWPVAMAPYYGDVAFDESAFPPWGGAEPYYYSNSFVATPDYWRRESRLAGTSQYQPIRQDLVRLPANKGLFLDTWTYAGNSKYWPPVFDGGPVLIGFADGSARSADRNALAPTYGPGPPEEAMSTWPVVHTVGGVDAPDVP